MKLMSDSELIIFNKPYGVICQFSHHEKYPSLKDYVPIPAVYPAGRLDTDSEGLLLLTANGKLQAKITHPKYKLLKTYWAQLEGTPDAQKLQQLQFGVDLGDFITQPAKVKLISVDESARLWPRLPPIRVRKTVPDFWLQLQISEGKNRQVRRMCAKVGWPCLRLVRVGIGRLNLFNYHLQPGQWQRVNSRELLTIDKV